jgi:ABC-type polysaccharide transport system permease subunit
MDAVLDINIPPARIKIPQDIYDAAEIDGATGARRFVHVTFPLLANLYLLCSLLSTLWVVGDFTTVYLVSGGGPAHSTDVLATLGFHYAFDIAAPPLGVARRRHPDLVARARLQHVSDRARSRRRGN